VDSEHGGGGGCAWRKLESDKVIAIASNGINVNSGEWRGRMRLWRSRLRLRCAALGRLRAYSKGLNIVNVEKIPEFTPAAAKLWTAIPPETRKLLLSNVWCSKCKDETTITNFTGAVKGGDLLLVGLCSICRGDVARVIESS
jgi:hypothetical protein